MKIYVSGATQIGGRAQNQDAYLIDSLHLCAEQEADAFEAAWESVDKALWFAVCDGAGGGTDGEVAAAAAVKTFQQQTRKLAAGTQTADAALEEVQRAVWLQSKSVGGNCGTTISFVMIETKDDETHFLAGNLGDSPIFLLRGGNIYKISDEHTVAAEKEQRGESTVFEYERHCLTRYLGMPAEEIATLFSFGTDKLRAGDCLLICSDGLSDYCAPKKLKELLSRPETTAESLCRLADETARDNITAVLIRAEG